jgi:hypothetical protein
MTATQKYGNVRATARKNSVEVEEILSDLKRENAKLKRQLRASVTEEVPRKRGRPAKNARKQAKSNGFVKQLRVWAQRSEDNKAMSAAIKSRTATQAQVTAFLRTKELSSWADLARAYGYKA